MAPGISLDDRSAWDDSALINSWDDAVSEYQKYHSIAKSGKRLEDVLTKEELERLRTDYGDLLDEETGGAADPTVNTDTTDAVPSQVQANDQEPSGPEEVNMKDRAATPVAQDSAAASGTQLPHDGSVPGSMPQLLLGSVQDENMKNLMMSWYYAGYYTGLVAGQQAPAQADASQRDQKQR